MKKLNFKLLLVVMFLTTSMFAQNIQETTMYSLIENGKVVVEEETLYYDIHRDVWSQETANFADIIVDSFTGDTIMTVQRLTKTELKDGLRYFYAHLITEDDKAFVKVIYTKQIYAIQLNDNSSVIFFLNE